MSTAFRVGIFVVLAMLFLSIGIFSIGDKDFLFSSTYRLRAEFQNVQASFIQFGINRLGKRSDIDRDPPALKAREKPQSIDLRRTCMSNYIRFLFLYSGASSRAA